MKIKAIDISKFRDKHGISQTDFAKLIGVSLRTVQNYESGGKIPDSKHEILHNIIKTYRSDTTYQEDLKDYNKELEIYKAKNINELREIAYKFIANEEKLYEHNLLPDNREMHFWLRYKEIIDDFGSIENYLNREV